MYYSIIRDVFTVLTVVCNVVTLVMLIQTRKLLKEKLGPQGKHTPPTSGSGMLHTSSGTNARSGH